MGTFIYVSYCRRGHHFTRSFEPHEGLAVCKAKRKPSLLSVISRPWVLFRPQESNSRYPKRSTDWSYPAMIKKGTNNTSHKRLTRQHPPEDAHKTSHLRDLLDSFLEGTRTLLHVGDLLGSIRDRTRTTLHIRVLPNSILERTRTNLHIRDLLDSVLKPWEAKCWRMHLSVTQSSYELSITCTVLETFQFSDIVTCQLCFFAQAVILSRHQVYLCKELCVLERKFWLEFGVKGKVSHEHTIFMINMLTGIKLRKDGQQKRATCFATLLQNELKNYFARFTTHESNLR